MGITRRLQRQKAQPAVPQARRGRMAISDTGITINGCRILLGHSDSKKVIGESKIFRANFGIMVSRSRCVNMGDMYAAHFGHLEKMKNG